MGQKKQKKRFLKKDPTKKSASTKMPRVDMTRVVVLVKSMTNCDVSPINKGVITLPGQIWQKGAPRSWEKRGSPNRELLIPRGMITSRKRSMYLMVFKRLKLSSSYLENLTPNQLLNLVIQSCRVPRGQTYPHQALLITRNSPIKVKNPIRKAFPLYPNRSDQVL